MVSPGWTIGVWIALGTTTSNAHLWGSSETTGSLRISVDATTRTLQLVSTQYANAGPIICRSSTQVQSFVWNWLSIVQVNTSSLAGGSPGWNATTLIYLNGALDTTCQIIPYFDNPFSSKSLTYIGLNPLASSEYLQAQVAQWAMWFYPLAPSEQAVLANEYPLAIAGPILVGVTPPIEAGVPLLNVLTKVLTITLSAPLRGTSSYQLCLVPIPYSPGAVSPACVLWSTNALLDSHTFSLTNPAGGAISFIWNGTFSGVNLGSWTPTFLLPPTLNFSSTIPYSQLQLTTETFSLTMNATQTAPTLTIFNGPSYMSVTLPGTDPQHGLAWMDVHSGAFVDMLLSKGVTRTNDSVTEPSGDLFTRIRVQPVDVVQQQRLQRISVFMSSVRSAIHQSASGRSNDIAESGWKLVFLLFVSGLLDLSAHWCACTRRSVSAARDDNRHHPSG